MRKLVNHPGSALLALVLLVGGCAQFSGDESLALAGTNTYRNPLELRLPDGSLAESCADPSVIYAQEGEGLWYLYCTTDPLNGEDRNASGDFNFRLIPMFSSSDLVNWTYAEDAFSTRPTYAREDAGLWAPEIAYIEESGSYHLYYTVTETCLPGTGPSIATCEENGSAIGVATSDGPLGPWTHADAPVIEPHPADCCPGSRRWVFDPDVIQVGDQRYIYYGSYFGGVSVRELSDDGLMSDPASQTNVAVANKYEGAEVVFRDGYYYLFVSATDCCRGPLTGYSVFVGRSSSPTGPFLDRDGVDLNEDEGPSEADPTDGRVGGTPVITMNGNRWVGPGHNTVFQDFDGQWWTIYHAIDRDDPYFAGAPGFTKRPALLDALDWVNGWPTLNGGRGPSDAPQHAPAAQPGEKTSYKPRPVRPLRLGKLIARASDEFRSGSLSGRWEWVRQPASTTYGLENGVFRFDTQAADLFQEDNSASVLLQDAPNGNYVVETRVRLNVPAEGCCFNFAQAGLVIYGGDDAFIKLVHVSIFNTRQTEFAREQPTPVEGEVPNRYGNTVVGAPGEWTLLRVVKRTVGGEEEYTAYTKRDEAGAQWTRGGTWTLALGKDAQIGLVSMGRSGFRADFDYVRVYRLNHGGGR